MRKIDFLSFLLVSTLSFSQTIEISQVESDQKYGLKNKDTGNMLTQYVYSKIKSFNGNYFACSLADTSFKGNCSLIDKQLNVIIPYGLFSEIILSENENYATVAGEEYVIRLRESNYDTTTIAKNTKEWGVCEITNKKMILPIKYNYLSKVYKDGIVVFNNGGISFMNDNFGQGGKFGMMNLKGQVICKDQYTFISEFNDKGIAIAVIGGDNTDGVSGGEFIAINKNGDNIKPNFDIDFSPIVKKITLKNDKNLITSDELKEFMNFKNEDDSLRRDSLFKSKFIIETDRQLFTDESGSSGQVSTIQTTYDIYEKDSKVDIWQPLPSNYKYIYNPEGSSIKNWGKYTQYNTNAIPLYSLFEATEKLPIASFCSFDSIFVPENDSLELDYKYPGIYNQNRKVLNRKYCDDARSKYLLYKKLNSLGLVYKQELIDTVKYTFKYSCDTAEHTIVFCKNSHDDVGALAGKYYYKKHMGLLVNQEVVLPPIYNYIIAKNKDEYLLLDSANALWDFNINTKDIKKSNLLFQKIINRRVNSEDHPHILPNFFVTKNSNNYYEMYDMDETKTKYIIDSLKIRIAVLEVNEEGMEFENIQYQNVNSEINSNNDFYLFSKDSIFEYDWNNYVFLFKDKYNHFLANQNIKSANKLELVNKPITIHKTTYNSYYTQNGFNLLETNNKKFVFTNGGVTTSNSIKVDSVVHLGPNMVYSYNHKMYLATFDEKEIIVQGKKVKKYFITKRDSAARIELPNNNNDVIYWGLYKADGVYKSYKSKKPIIFIPSNFEECKKENTSLCYDDKDKGALRQKKLFIISKNNMNYLCELQAMKIIQDSLNNTVKSIFDSQYQVLDSAKLFEVRNADNDFSDYYIFKGTYKSDGILKSANSFKKLPIQYADSITLLQVDQINVETFAFCKNKQWKLLCVNLLKSEEFIILQDFTFNSLHDIRKLLYPYNISGSDCIDSKEKQLIKRKFEELSEKASDKVQW